jgi:hypothetical protein
VETRAAASERLDYRMPRASERLKAWAKLLALRDERIREQTLIKENGEAVVIEVVPSAKELREACRLILSYCWGNACSVWS